MRILVLVVLGFFGGVSGQLLKASNLSTTLPTPLEGLSAIYDGDDSIYLFGGQSDGFSSESDAIYRFSIAQETVVEIAQMPSTGSRGSVQYSPDQKSIFYFGGYNWTYNAVFQFNTDANYCSMVAVFNHSVNQGPSVSMGDTAIIFGALGNFDLWAFDMSNLEAEKVGSFPTTPPRVAYEHTVVKVGDTLAYVFNDGSTKGDENVVVFNLTTFESEVVPTSLPNMRNQHPASVFDGKYVYLIGGHANGTSGMDTNGIIRFDPELFEHSMFKVEEYPVGGKLYFETAPATVFVEKLNRIYLFGGLVKEDGNFAYKKTLNDISYIDLAPLSEGGDETTTENSATYSPTIPTVPTEAATLSSTTTDEQPTTRSPYTQKTPVLDTNDECFLGWIIAGVVLMNLISFGLGWLLSTMCYNSRRNKLIPVFLPAESNEIPITSKY